MRIEWIFAYKFKVTLMFGSVFVNNLIFYGWLLFVDSFHVLYIKKQVHSYFALSYNCLRYREARA